MTDDAICGRSASSPTCSSRARRPSGAALIKKFSKGEEYRGQVPSGIVPLDVVRGLYHSLEGCYREMWSYD